mmetsp:Transcript_105244/g.302642  ORF Transcript_105244/g.302642 Transcript_105244/m.302642 type:complete len:211 (+) Transcript_105244:306-938(+)
MSSLNSPSRDIVGSLSSGGHCKRLRHKPRQPPKKPVQGRLAVKTMQRLATDMLLQKHAQRILNSAALLSSLLHGPLPSKLLVFCIAFQLNTLHIESLLNEHMASEAVPAHLRQATAATPRVVRPCGAVRRIDIRVANTCGPQTATASSTWCRRGHRSRCGCRGRCLGGCHSGSRGRRNFCRRGGRGSRRRARGSKGRLGFRLRLGLGLGS